MTQLSFEVFSPKSIPASFQLSRAMAKLARFNPAFTSVTCGTGGGADILTDETVIALRRQNIGPIVAHVTCGAKSREQLSGLCAKQKSAGVVGLVALRGDQAGGIDAPGVSDLVGCIHKESDLDIYVAAYPETHPLAASPAADLDALKAKQDAGATAAITQFFFEPDTFLSFRDRAVAHGITMPIYPGILPVSNWTATEKMARTCGTAVDPDLAEGFARAAREGRTSLMATAHAAENCDKLLRHGVDHLHFYTMNRAHVVSDICIALGLDQNAPLRQVA